MIKKGLSPLLSGVIYMAIILTGITIALTSLNPIIQQMYKNIEISKNIDCYNNLEKAISELKSYSSGSEIKVQCSIREGFMKINKDKIIIGLKNIDTETLEAIKDKAIIEEGVYVHDNGTFITLGNSIIELSISKESDNINKIINYIKHKTSGNLLTQTFNMSINYDDMLSKGKITVEAEEFGNFLPYGKTIIRINNNYINEKISFILYPKSDYIVINIES